MLGLGRMPDRSETIVYCLTRDRELAVALEERLTAALAFFYNDAARLSQAVVLRLPDLVVIDTGAIREEYGDAGLGPSRRLPSRAEPWRTAHRAAGERRGASRCGRGRTGRRAAGSRAIGLRRGRRRRVRRTG